MLEQESEGQGQASARPPWEPLTERPQAQRQQLCGGRYLPSLGDQTGTEVEVRRTKGVKEQGLICVLFTEKRQCTTDCS